MIRSQISQLIQDAYDGNESAAKAFAELKELKTVIDAGLKVIEDAAKIEAREFNKGEIYYGGSWEFRSSGVTLDFTKDETYTKLNTAALARKKDLNAAWKAHENGKGFFDNESGEELPILPVKIPAKESLIFKPKP